MKKITLTAIKNTTAAFDKLSVSKIQKLTLVLLLLIFGIGQDMTAQVVTLNSANGNGIAVANVNKGRDAGKTPFAVAKNKSRVQYLYDHADMHNTFPDAGTISHIGFNITNLNSSSPKEVKNARLRVWVISDNQRNGFKTSTHMSIIGWSVPKVDIALGDLTITSAGWYDFDLGAQAFAFNEGDGKNIVIEFSNDNTGDRATQNFTVAVHTASQNYSRGRYSVDDANTSLPAGAASDMNSSSTDAPGSAAMNMYWNTERKIRPDVRFTFKCDGPGAGGQAIIVDAGTGCLGAPVKITINNASTASGLGYQWQSASSLAGPWTNIATGTAATYTASTEMTAKYYKRKTFCLSSVTDIVYSQAAKVNAADWNTYNGTTWSKGYAPSESSTESIVINGGTYTIGTNVKACSCMVGPNANLVVASGQTLTLTGPIVNGAGSITFEDGSALLQPNGVVNTGKVTYKRISQPMIKFDFTYWSSPVYKSNLVSGTTFAQFSPGTLSDKFYSWNNTTQNWNQEHKDSVMVAGRGYIIRSPQSFPTTGANATVYNGEFKGVPFNGDTIADVASQGNYSLIGNPFPSALDADAIINDSQNQQVFNGTIYFWTHSSPVASSYANSSDNNTNTYNNDDYASYNLSGGTEGPSARYIGAGQSFMVVGRDSGGDLKLSNSMRAGGANNASFYRAASNNVGKAPAVSASGTPDSAAKHRVWLQLANATNYKQVLVGYIPGATTGIDYGFDGVAMTGTGLGFYSLVNGVQLGIQGRALPFDAEDQVPMGFATNVAGTHTISMYNNDGVFATEDVNVFLQDNLTGVLHNLKESAYTFSTTAGTFNDRFVLKYSASVSAALSTTDFAAVDSVVVYKQQQSLHVNSKNASIKNVKVFDLSGRMLISKSDIDGNEVVFDNMNWSSQVIIVQTLTDDNILTTKKVVF